jgi:hypothetical protein
MNRSTPGVRGVGVVYDSVLEGEGAQPLAPWRHAVDVAEVVFRAAVLLLLAR